MVSPLSTALLLLAAAVSPSQAAIAAWWNGIGPQILIHNTTTGAVRHSPCNSFGTAYYSHTDSSEVPLTYKPKNGTALAGVGYWNEKTTIASIYYVERDGAIANALLECNMDTGLFKSKGNWIISGEDPVHPNTSLAGVLLGAAGGYRVYYHDAEMTVNEIGYTAAVGSWTWRGTVSRDPQASPALGAFFTGKENITVASIRDTQNVQVMRYNSDTNWWISTFPKPLAGNLTTQNTNATSFAYNETVPLNFTLPAWDAKSKSLGVSIDSEFTRSVWYIGSDKALYGARNKNFSWGMQPNQTDAFWPLADTPGAEFGVASETKNSMVRIYYFVKGELAEIKYEKGEWKPWAALAEPPKIAVNGTTNQNDPNSTTAPASSGPSGLSSGAKAGIAVGVVLGVIAIIALLGAFYLIRKRTNRTPSDSVPPEGAYMDSAADPHTTKTTPAPAYGDWEKKQSPQQPYPAQLDSPNPPVMMDATSPPTELAAPGVMYELPVQNYSAELVGDTFQNGNGRR